MRVPGVHICMRAREEGGRGRGGRARTQPEAKLRGVGIEGSLDSNWRRGAGVRRQSCARRGGALRLEAGALSGVVRPMGWA